MKKHLLIIVATTLTICSCKTLSTHTIGYTADTLHIKTLHYDSIFIDRQTLTTYSHDTVYVDRWQTEYRYRLHTDTMHHYHTDTVCTTIYKEAPNNSNEVFPWVIVVVVLVGVVLRSLRQRFRRNLHGQCSANETIAQKRRTILVVFQLILRHSYLKTFSFLSTLRFVFDYGIFIDKKSYCSLCLNSIQICTTFILFPFSISE